MKDDKPWFAPKRFGYGAGLPIAWQGWAFGSFACRHLVCSPIRFDVTEVGPARMLQPL